MSAPEYRSRTAAAKNLHSELKGTNRENERCHYAILKRDIEAPEKTKLDEMGIKAIWIKDHDEIPRKLGELYQAGLSAKGVVDSIALPFSDGNNILIQKLPHMEYVKDVWNLIRACRQGRPREKQLRSYEAESASAGH